MTRSAAQDSGVPESNEPPPGGVRAALPRSVEPRPVSPGGSDRIGTLDGKRRAEDYWKMPWQEFEVALGQRNVLGLRSLNISTMERAQEFLKHCGFDTHRADHMRNFEQMYAESLHIIRHVLMSDEERQLFTVPADIATFDDCRRILLLASQRSPRRRYVRLWACSILKVMNAIANLEVSGRLHDLDVARDTLFGRIRSLIHTGQDGTVVRSHGRSVPLAAVDWKEAKTRTSIVLKLLHKPDSIVDEVFDYLGVRFVVPTQTDIPHLLRLLIEADVIIPHQVIGLRTRNTLFNLPTSQRLLTFSTDLLSMGTLDPEEFNSMCQRIPWAFRAGDLDAKRANAHSSSFYRSVQLTVRHLVRTPNPAALVLDSLTSQLRHFRGLEQENDPLLSSLVPAEIARYFPIEIQILDSGSYDISKFGPASHEQYKASQLKAVRTRVLGGLLFYTAEKLATQEF